MKVLKISGIIIAIILIILIITNPSYTKFKNFSKDVPVKGIYTNTKQSFNGLIFSIYIKEAAYTWGNGRQEKIRFIIRTKYCGCFLNFFEISKEKDGSQYGQTISK